MQLFIIIAMGVALGSVMFALQNNVPVTVTFLIWRFDSSLAMVLLMALALGALVVALLSTPATVRRQWHARQQGKQIADLEKANQQLRNEVDSLRSQWPAESEAAAEPRPYVGLKQLFGSGGDEAGKTPASPASEH